MIGKKYNSKRSKMDTVKKQNITVLIICVIVVAVTIIGVQFIPKKENSTLKESIASNKENGSLDESNKEDELVQNDQVVGEELEVDSKNNVNYIKLEDDPNADDAVMVSENTKGLLNGTKNYPVRTDGKRVVYLTFDDGPSTTNTPQILDILDQYNVKATFFVLGKMLEAGNGEKDVLKDIAENGHAIANHTYGHDYAYLYPNGTMNVDNIVSDVEKNNDIMKEILGDDFSTRVIRFPGGYWSWEGRTPMRDKMIETGYCNIDWNALNEDAQGAVKTADELVQKTKENIERLGPDADSVVLLMHDTYGKEETVKALPQIIEYLQDKGFEFRTIK